MQVKIQICCSMQVKMQSARKYSIMFYLQVKMQIKHVICMEQFPWPFVREGAPRHIHPQKAMEMAPFTTHGTTINLQDSTAESVVGENTLCSAQALCEECGLGLALPGFLFCAFLKTTLPSACHTRVVSGQ